MVRPISRGEKVKPLTVTMTPAAIKRLDALASEVNLKRGPFLEKLLSGELPHPHSMEGEKLMGEV